MHLARIAAVLAAICLSLATQNVFSSAARAGETVKADNLVIDLGTSAYRIAHLEAEGSTLGAAELASLFDEQNHAPPEERLARLSAARIVIPEIVGETDAGGVKQRIVYRDVVLENVAAGRIGAFRAASLSQTTQGRGAPIEARYAAATARGVDLVQIAHVLAKISASATEPVKTLQDEAAVDSGVISIADKKLEIRIGRASTRDVKARALQTPATQSLPATPAAGPDGGLSPALAQAVLDVLRASEIGAFELRDLALTGEAGGKPVSVKIGRLALTKLAAGTVGAIDVDDLAATGPEGGGGALRRLVLRGVDLAPLFGQGERRTPHVSHAEIAGLDATIAKTGETARNSFKIAAASADLGNYRDNLPTKFSLAVDHLTADLTAQAETATIAALLALGYKELDLSGALVGEWRETDNELTVAELSLDDTNKGRLNVASTFVNVTGDAFSADPATAQAALFSSLLKRVDVTIENKGLFDRLLEQDARTRRSTPARLREDYASAAAASVPAFFDNSEQSRVLASALAKFIAEPKRLQVTLDSAKGVGLADAASSDPGELLRDTKLEAQAE